MVLQYTLLNDYARAIMYTTAHKVRVKSQQIECPSPGISVVDGMHR
jgi:hypothetical protein